jgi:lysylphosphatidylglycerol synthetase-like protein (DUF2156 family)
MIITRERAAMNGTSILAQTSASADLTLDAIQRYSHADNPSAFLAVNEGNSYFHVPGTPGVIVYRPAGRYLVQFGGPFAPKESRRDLLRAFIEFAAGQDREIVSVQLQGPDTAEYIDEGFTINQMGASFVLGLDTFSLRGTAFMQLRNKIARALRTGLEISEVPCDPSWLAAVKELDAGWLTIKGGAKQLEFLVGQVGGPYQHMRRLFIGQTNGRLMGYISFSPVYGSRPGWMHDLSRRQPDSPPGVMEAINKAAIEKFQDEGVAWEHFGFTPFTALSPERQFPGYSPGFLWFMGELWANGKDVYPAQTQFAYAILAEYIAFQHGASIPALVHIFRACNAV